MRKAEVFNFGVSAGFLLDHENGTYEFVYHDDYKGPPISLTMPVAQRQYLFDKFPPFFDGVLPEGVMLQALLKRAKIDRHDYFQQLVTVGDDLVGSVTVKACV